MAWATLWRRLDSSRRREAALAFWESPETAPEDRDLAEGELARRLHFRPQSVRKLPRERKARYLAEWGNPPGILVQLMLQQWLLNRRPMLIRFLDTLRIPHREGLFEEDAFPIRSRDDLARAADVLYAEFPEDEVDLYLSYLLEAEPEHWPELGPVLEERRGERAPPEHPEEEGLQGDEGESPQGAPEPVSPGFTTLDRVLVRVVIDGISGVEGSLSLDQIEDLIDEVVHLNSSRQVSYFHRGFFDRLRGGEVCLDLPELNTERAAWLLCGAVMAAARQGDQQGILDLLQGHPLARQTLRRGGLLIVPAAIPLVFEALVGTGRFTELAEWLGPEEVSGGGISLWRGILWEAGGLLRRGRAEEARPLLDLVEAAVGRSGELSEAGPEQESLVADLRRRKAHCLRLRGDLEGARSLLSSLLESAAPDRRAMILADLGLVEAGYRSLSDVRLPVDPARYAEVVECLSRGEEFFTLSAAERPSPGAHGQYCLGVLWMARGEPEKARPFLEEAVAEMQRRPETYGEVVLPRARLYLGACLAYSWDPVRADQAAACLEEGVEKLGQESLPLLPDALAALEEVSVPVAARLARKIHELLGNRFLDAVVGTGVLPHVAELREALARRARRKGRSAGERRADLEVLLRAAKEAEDAEMGEAALDGLEELALEGTGAEDLLRILGSEEYRGFVLSHEEAEFLRVRLLESAGRVGEAAAILEGLGHEILTRKDRPNWLAEAEDLADHIRSHGLEPGEAFLARIEGCRREARESPPRTVRGRVLFLGGNETQERYDEEVRARIHADWPEVELSFHHPGWSSNWGRQIDRWANDIRTADAVVLMRFVRTQFGRKVRQICHEHKIPWVACTGHGRDSILRAVKAAVACL